MATSNPTNTQWIIEQQTGIQGLQSRLVQIPQSLGEHEVLVKIHAASLNARDLAVAKAGSGAASLVAAPNVVPGSDGAGVVLFVGRAVTSFSVGDKVVTHMVPHIPSSTFPTFAEVQAGLGQQTNGTLQEYGLFHESALVHMPRNLTFEEAATLTCSALTAWNALFGGGRKLGKGDTVLTQGTGGVSIAALQFAHAAGATVISMTSSDEKAEGLTALGAGHTINYKTDSSWGKTAHTLSGDGVTNVIDVGGLSTLSESLDAVRVEGTVTVTGILGSSSTPPSILDVLWKVCSVRGVILGSRQQFKDMVRFIEENDIKPVIDKRIFGIQEVREAYRWIEEQKHFSKVVIKIQ